MDQQALTQLRQRPRNEPTTSVVSALQRNPYGAVVLDIEGTTTPITFVHDVLFPYARQHVRAFLERNFDVAGVQEDLRALVTQAETDTQAGMSVTRIALGGDRTATIDAAVRNVLERMSLDRKTTGLKSLQGKIWAEGYARGDLTALVYNDVPLAFKRWHNTAFESTSTVAGRLQRSCCSDIHSLRSDAVYRRIFDTTGPKRDENSYVAIARAARRFC